MFGSDLFNQLDILEWTYERGSLLVLHCSSIEEPLPGGRLFNERLVENAMKDVKKRTNWMSKGREGRAGCEGIWQQLTTHVRVSMLK